MRAVPWTSSRPLVTWAGAPCGLSWKNLARESRPRCGVCSESFRSARGNNECRPGRLSSRSSLATSATRAASSTSPSASLSCGAPSRGPASAPLRPRTARLAARVLRSGTRLQTSTTRLQQRSVAPSCSTTSPAGSSLPKSCPRPTATTHGSVSCSTRRASSVVSDSCTTHAGRIWPLTSSPEALRRASAAGQVVHGDGVSALCPCACPLRLVAV